MVWSGGSRMKHVLVTGIGGFAGHHVASALLKVGCAVSGIYRSRKPCSSLSCPALHTIRADLRQPIPDSILAGVDAVVHCAGQSQASNRTVSTNLDDNVASTRNLVEFASARGCQRFIYLSSLSVYGTIRNDEVVEGLPIVNPSPYGISKLLGELLLSECSMQSLSIRLPSVIGPGAHTNWLSRMLESAKANEPIAIYNPDAPFNNAVHVEDLAALIVQIVAGPDWSHHETINLAADGSMSIYEVANTFRELVNADVPIDILPSSSNSFVINIEKAKSRFGYKPKYVREALRDYISRPHLDSQLEQLAA